MEKEIIWLKRTAIRMKTLFAASNRAGYFLLLSITMVMTMNST